MPVTREPSTGEGLVDDVNVEGIAPIIPPAILLEEFELNEKGKETVSKARRSIRAVKNGEDDRLIVIVGPCSIHDPILAREYANKLVTLLPSLEEDLIVIMRVYFEKPRTTVGWKGLINDPELNSSNKINKGLRIARSLLVDICGLGLPVGCEFLDTITPQFIADTVSWGAIGARTTESQIHRELASGCSMPIGFKNGTDGNLQIAVDAIRAAAHPHTFPGVTKQGLAAIVKTKGNGYCHVILRGSTSGPNYSSEYVQQTKEMLGKSGLKQQLFIDASHGNSCKKHENQPIVTRDICKQIASGEQAITGVMIESNINAGNQSFTPGKTDPKSLKFGVSITDACVAWDTTVEMLEALAASVRTRRSKQ